MRRRSIHILGRILLALVATAGLFVTRATGQADAEAAEAPAVEAQAAAAEAGEAVEEAEESPKASVWVQVLQPDDAPLANTEVLFRLTVSRKFQGFADIVAMTSDSVTTDAEGWFCLEHRPGRWRLNVRIKGTGFAVAEPFDAVAAAPEPQKVVLKLQVGASASGRVVDAAGGEPVANASVYAEAVGDEEGEPATTMVARTDAGGNWTIRNMPAGRWKFNAYQVDHLPRQAGEPITLEDGKSTGDISLRLTTAARLHGLIVHADGTPVAEAEVTVGWERLDGDRVDFSRSQGLVTDAEGKFGIPGQVGGRYCFRIYAEGHGYGASEPFDVPEGGHSERIKITLAPGAKLAGVCIDKATGKPLAGVHVVLSTADDEDELVDLPNRLSDEQGRWQWTAIPPGRWQLYAYCEEYHNAEATVTVTAGAVPEEIRLELQPFGVLRGTVVAADGKTPVAGARLRLAWGEKDVTTGADGRFTMTLPTLDEIQMTIAADGYAVHEISLGGAMTDPGKELTIVLSARGGTVRGRVFDQDTGKPVAGQEVFLVPCGEDDPFGWIVRDDNFWAHNAESFRQWGGAEKIVSARTDAQGVYAAEHVQAGPIMAVVCPKGGIAVHSPEVELTEGGVADADVTVTSHPLGFVVVRLVKPDGTPLGETQLWTQVSHSMRWGPWGENGNNSTTSDGRTLFRIRQAGTFKLTLLADGYRTIEHTFELPDTDLTVDAEFHLVPETADAVIAGRVFLPDGKTPAAGASVTPFAVDRPVLNCQTQTSFGDKSYYFLDATAVTSGDGSFRVTGLRPGAYGLYVSPHREVWGDRSTTRDELKDCVPVTTAMVEVVESGQVGGVVAVLKQGGVLQGKVVDAKTGKPIADASVDPDWDTYRGFFSHVVEPPDVMLGGHSANTDKDGSFRIVLPPGQYTLGIWAEGYGYKHFDGWKAVKILAGATVERTIQLEAE